MIGTVTGIQTDARLGMRNGFTGRQLIRLVSGQQLVMRLGASSKSGKTSKPIKYYHSQVTYLINLHGSTSLFVLQIPNPPTWQVVAPIAKKVLLWRKLKDLYAVDIIINAKWEGGSATGRAQADLRGVAKETENSGKKAKEADGSFEKFVKRAFAGVVAFEAFKKTIKAVSEVFRDLVEKSLEFRMPMDEVRMAVEELGTSINKIQALIGDQLTAALAAANTAFKPLLDQTKAYFADDPAAKYAATIEAVAKFGLTLVRITVPAMKLLLNAINNIRLAGEQVSKAIAFITGDQAGYRMAEKNILNIQNGWLDLQETIDSAQNGIEGAFHSMIRNADQLGAKFAANDQLTEKGAAKAIKAAQEREAAENRAAQKIIEEQRITEGLQKKLDDNRKKREEERIKFAMDKLKAQEEASRAVGAQQEQTREEANRQLIEAEDAQIKKQEELDKKREQGIQAAAAATNSFLSTLIRTGDAGGAALAFLDSVLSSIIQKLSEIIAKQAAFAVLNYFTGGLFGALFGADGGGVSKFAIGEGYAAGGFVSGGTPGRDSVPAMLMPGEFVLPKHTVDSIRNGTPPSNSHYANGGPVVSTSPEPATSLNFMAFTTSRAQVRKLERDVFAPERARLSKNRDRVFRMG